MPAIARFYQRGKNGVHGLQALLIFIGAAVTIAIFVKGGQGDGRIRYYFALVSNLNRVANPHTYFSPLSAGFVYLLSSTKLPSPSSSEQRNSQTLMLTQSSISYT